MESTQEHRELIEKLIKNNSRFSGNEDLLDDFCSETFKRSYNILSTINNVQNIERYINKVANSAILEVLKTSGRLIRTSKGYVQSQEQPISNVETYKTNEQGFLIFEIPDLSSNFEEEIATKDQIRDFIQKISELNQLEPEKQFLQIFNLRYFENLKQSEISNKLNISQGEVSKRLIEISQKISDFLV